MAVRQEFSGTRLRTRRKDLGLNRTTLAFALGVCTDTIGNWERGFCAPNKTATLVALAEVLECDVQDLFERELVDA